jgi:hypothetical protein
MPVDVGRPIQFRVACGETLVGVHMVGDWEYRRTVMHRGRVSGTGKTTCGPLFRIIELYAVYP